MPNREYAGGVGSVYKSRPEWPVAGIRDPSHPDEYARRGSSQFAAQASLSLFVFCFFWTPVGDGNPGIWRDIG